MICVIIGELFIRNFYPEYNPIGNIEFQNKGDNLILAPANFEGRQWRSSGDFNVEININSYGFRDTKDLKESTSKDLFVIGDSFCFGHGVEEEERFSNKLQELLADTIRIYNIGISGSHVKNYEKQIAYAKEHGANVKNIVLGIFMGNDIYNYEDLKESRIETPLDSKKAGLKEWLFTNTSLYNFIAYRIQSVESIRNFLVKVGLAIDPANSFPQIAFGEEKLRSTANQVELIVKNHNHLVVIIPVITNWIGEERETILKEHDYFISLLREKNIRTLDMKVFFEKETKNPAKDFHFKNDAHWNRDAHQLAAEAIYKAWQN